MQLLALWPMAKLVLKQSVKAHGPLVLVCSEIEKCPNEKFYVHLVSDVAPHCQPTPLNVPSEISENQDCQQGVFV